MILTRQIALPRDASFYSKEFEYGVSIDPDACGQFDANIGGSKVSFTYSLDAELAKVIRPLKNGNLYKTTLENILDAAVRYYRTGDPQFSMPELLDQRFLLARDFGFAFRHTLGGSLAHESLTLRKLHSERTKQVTELFGYGLAIDFARKLFNVPPERFFFITGAGARADFRAHLSERDLTGGGGNVALVSTSGYVFNLEVKAYSGWDSYRAQSTEGKELLYGIHAKATSSSRGVFLAAIAALPLASTTTKPTGRCRIILADPGEPLKLGENDQVVIILDEILVECLRFGLWPTAWRILQWLERLGVGAVQYTAMSEQLGSFASKPQYSTESRTIDGVRYIGRTFSEALILLGNTGNRRLTRREAFEVLSMGGWGTFWFSGLHEAIIKAISDEDVEALLSFHIALSQAEGSRGAVYVEYVEPNASLVSIIEGEFERVLSEKGW